MRLAIVGAAAAAALVLAAVPAGGANRKRDAAPPPRAAPAASTQPASTTPVARGRLYAVVLGPGPAWKKGQPFKGPGLDEHRRYWKKLHGEGRVASAGPLGADTGLAMVRAASQKEADALIAADPAVRARILRGVARPYDAALVSTPVLVGR